MDQAYDIENAINPFLNLSALDITYLQPVRRIFEHGSIEHPYSRQNKNYPALQVHILLHDVSPGDIRDFSGVRLFEKRADPEERGFSAPVRAHDGLDTTSVKRAGAVAQDGLAFVMLRDV